MIITGIDPGAHSGVAILEIINTSVKESITVLNTYPVSLMPASRKSGKIAGGRRLQDYIDQLLSIFIDHQPDKIYCEEPFIKFRNASKSMNRLLAAVDIAAHMYRHDTVVGLINPSVVKKTVSGNGKIDKEPLAKVVMKMVTNPNMVQSLIDNKSFDVTDSIAIALAGNIIGDI